MSDVLNVRNLSVTFPSEDGPVRAVRGLSFGLRKGETMGLVGESGSGKSVTSLAVMGLHAPSARVRGSVTLEDEELIGKTDAEMSKIRGKRIAMVFQDPLSALTPVYGVGQQIAETILIHNKVSKREAWDRAVALLDDVGIPDAAERAKAYPFEFSGGMRQRVMIAMAMANQPDLIIADEPTTALDVTIQAQVMDLLAQAQHDTGAAMILITHDLGVVAGSCDFVTVMYAGRAVEQGTVDEIFSHAAMPYTIGLLGTVPRLDQDSTDALPVLEGNPPQMNALPPGCPFAARCPIALPICHTTEPQLQDVPARPIKPMAAPDHGYSRAEVEASETNGAANAPAPAPAGAPVTNSGDRPTTTRAIPHRAACHRVAEIVEHGWGHADIFEVPDLPIPEYSATPRLERDAALEITQLEKTFPLLKGALYRRHVGEVHAVDKIDLDIREGETLGLVGESGSGKSTTLLQVLDLVKPQAGSISVLGHDTATLTKKERKELRQHIQVVFQDPMAAVDPRLPVFDIIAEPMEVFGYGKEKIERRVMELLKLVGLDESHANRYPQHFSGGQRQRIGIARALALGPKVLVLDEPVSALDVSIQAGVINLLQELQGKFGLSYLLVAHDLAVIRHIADRVAVMYLGQIVEIGDVTEVYERPQHPYTQALISAIPIPDPAVERARNRVVLQGDLPNPANPPSGCKFRTRCPLFTTLTTDEQKRCVDEQPAMRSGGGDDHRVACHYARVVEVL
ncbi:MAG: dipeptide ABC transporter ATP-binding protein [Propionibacteriaceae bacterium]|jgi:peptide/nickel transport system ATP-binding protein|nr:dipeptide ABC transporter ATP-binding protein [Propionibacteriaceae bacterium]